MLLSSCWQISHIIKIQNVIDSQYDVFLKFTDDRCIIQPWKNNMLWANLIKSYVLCHRANKIMAKIYRNCLGLKISLDYGANFRLILYMIVVLGSLACSARV